MVKKFLMCISNPWDMYISYGSRGPIISPKLKLIIRGLIYGLRGTKHKGSTFYVTCVESVYIYQAVYAEVKPLLHAAWKITR